MNKIAQHTFDRIKASVYSVGAGIMIGLYNAYYPPIDFSFDPGFFGWLAAALITVAFLHEWIHGGVALLFGYKPIFGVKPPLVYVTFTEKIRRGQFMAITLAPLIVLDVLFGSLLAAGIVKEFSYFCLIINTLGAVGDVWMSFKLIPYSKSVFVQDTKTGIEVWSGINN